MYVMMNIKSDSLYIKMSTVSDLVYVKTYTVGDLMLRYILYRGGIYRYTGGLVAE